MDCSSPYAMARLIGMREKFDVAFANDMTPTGTES
jgi:phosphoglucomutase